MKLEDFLAKESVIAELYARERQEVLHELAKVLCKEDPGLQPEEVYQIFQEREKLGSTGIGEGVAIPHGKSPYVKRMLVGFGRSSKGIDFASQDGEPTYLFFALLAPENAAGLHLKLLAKLSRILKNRAFREKLIASRSAEDLYQLLINEEDAL